LLHCRPVLAALWHRRQFSTVDLVYRLPRERAMGGPAGLIKPPAGRLMATTLRLVRENSENFE
jgi:hypothetical protein